MKKIFPGSENDCFSKSRGPFVSESNGSQSNKENNVNPNRNASTSNLLGFHLGGDAVIKFLSVMKLVGVFGSNHSATLSTAVSR